MHEQPIDGDPVERENSSDWSVLSTLLIDNEAPWSVDELIQGLGDDRISVINAIGRLRRGGLIRRTADDLIFPTRVAVYFDQIHG